jgi:hypothetical protein
MPTLVLIGHCGPDSYLMKSAVSRAVPGVIVVIEKQRKTPRAYPRSPGEPKRSPLGTRR